MRALHGRCQWPRSLSLARASIRNYGVLIRVTRSRKRGERVIINRRGIDERSTATVFFHSSEWLFSIFRMLWLSLATFAVTVTAQGSYDLDGRVPYPGKSSSLGPLYSSGQGFRDNSYEDNIVTPTPTPAYRPNSQPPVSNECFVLYILCISFYLFEACDTLINIYWTIFHRCNLRIPFL